MTKVELINEISRSTGIAANSTSEVLECLMKTIKRTLADNESVYLRGFGTFSPKIRAAKTARNITTGEQIFVAEHSVPAFKPSKEFVELLK